MIYLQFIISEIKGALFKITRIKDNPARKSGQLIEYNKSNIFIEKSHKKAVQKLI